jgi:hypothetical protein
MAEDQATQSSNTNTAPEIDDQTRADLVHHVMYGQPGNPSDDEDEGAEYVRVQKSNWGVEDFQDTAVLEWHVPLTLKPLRKMAKGFIPRDMDGTLSV